jgi:hypothetical protein
MPGEAHGECIILCEADGGGRYDDEAYVRGHVGDAAFRAAIAATHDEDDDTPEYGPTRHVWARWEFSGQDDYGNPWRTLAEHRTPGPGKFAVTAATLASTLRRQEATRRQQESDVSELLGLYPGCVVVRANGCGRDYRLRTPNGAEVMLQWRAAERKWSGWARGVDVPGWNAYLDSIRGGADAR